MKYENINKAIGLHEEYKKIQQNISDASGERLGITFHGTYQKEDFVKLIRPHVLEELNRRLDEVKSKLKELGVEFSVPAVDAGDSLDKLRRDLENPFEIVKKSLEKAGIPFIIVNTPTISTIGRNGGVLEIPMNTVLINNLKDLPARLKEMKATFIFLYQVDSPGYSDVNGCFKVRFAYFK